VDACAHSRQRYYLGTKSGEHRVWRDELRHVELQPARSSGIDCCRP
jgi:hypothetical protein